MRLKRSSMDTDETQQGIPSEEPVSAAAIPDSGARIQRIDPLKRQAGDFGIEVCEKVSSKRQCFRRIGCPCCGPTGQIEFTGVLSGSDDAAAAATIRDPVQGAPVTEALVPYVDTHCHLEEVLQTVARHLLVPTLHKQVTDFNPEELQAWRVLGWATDTAAVTKAGAAVSRSTAVGKPSSFSLPLPGEQASPVWSSRWDDLSEEQRQAAIQLGYDSDGWNRNLWLLPRKTRWQALDDAVQRSLLRLGETPASWDNWNGIGATTEGASAASSFTRLNASDMRIWDGLSAKEQEAARFLGFTEATFNCEELADVGKTVDELFGPLFDGCITQGCDAESIGFARLLAAAHPKIYASFGCHPKSAWSYDDAMEARLLEGMEVRDASGRRKAIAWGEFGLDFSHATFGLDGENRRRQKEVFARQLRLAIERGFPLVVHSRGADRDTLRIMRRLVPRDWQVHVHSFRGGLQFLEALVSGWTRTYIGIPGIITMKDLDAQNICRACPLERMVLETDAPYLPLANSYFSHPGQIPQITAKVAELKGITLEEVSTVMRKNARDMYGF